MNLIISGIHIENFPEAENYAKEKVAKLEKFHPKIEEIKVRLFFEKSHHNQDHDFACEIRAVIPGNDAEVFESELSIEKAIDMAVDTMKRALVKSKEKITTKKHRMGVELRNKS